MFTELKRALLFLLVVTMFLFITSSKSIFAQALEATVSLELQSLPQEKQDKLRDFADQIAYYINSFDWCGDPWNTIVYVDLQLKFDEISTGAEERYKGTIVGGNNYDIQFSDVRWRFAYRSGDLLEHDENVQDSFTSLIDFYMYIILGGEFDKWGTLEGTQYYEKARNVAEQSKFGLGRFIEGWDRRLDYINYILSERHKPFREMVDYYFYGLSFVREDNAKARKHCATAIKMLDRILADDPENEYGQRFIQAHNSEFIEIFKRAKDKSTVRTLLVLDPGNESIYRDILNN